MYRVIKNKLVLLYVLYNSMLVGVIFEFWKISLNFYFTFCRVLLFKVYIIDNSVNIIWEKK